MFDAIKQFFSRATEGVVRDGPAAMAPAETYNDFQIQPQPRKEGSQWLTAGVISKEDAHGRREVEFIRSDMFASRDDAVTCALVKGRLIIDQLGERVFDHTAP